MSLLPLLLLAPAHQSIVRSFVYDSHQSKRENFNFKSNSDDAGSRCALRVLEHRGTDAGKRLLQEESKFTLSHLRSMPPELIPPLACPA